MKTTIAKPPAIRRVNMFSNGDRLALISNAVIEMFVSDREHILQGDVVEGASLIATDEEVCPKDGVVKKVYVFKSL